MITQAPNRVRAATARGARWPLGKRALRQIQAAIVLRVALAATRKLVRDPQLRRLMAVCATFLTSNSAHGVLLTVFAFSVGGAATVGVVTLVRMLPSALLAPLAATLATSPRPQVHLAIGVGARGMTTDRKSVV